MASRAGIALGTVAVATVVAIGVAMATQNDDSSSNRAPAAYAPRIDPARFTSTVDNPYFPLTPGTTWVYEGRTEDETERIVVTVTKETRTVMGVACVVVRDTVSVDGEVHEDTFDWFAQDAEGNVWYFGEDTKEYDKGKVESTEGSWEAGVDGAQPGIVMKARPVVGESYRQEYYEGEAEDMGQVLSLTETVTGPTGTYTDVLRTKDWTPLEPDVEENKFYARGVGVVREETVKGGKDSVQLISVSRQ